MLKRHAARRATALWTSSKVHLNPARVPLRLLWRHHSRMPLHVRDHPALSGQDQRAVARPYRHSDRSARGAVPGIARGGVSGILRRYVLNDFPVFLAGPKASLKPRECIKSGVKLHFSKRLLIASLIGIFRTTLRGVRLPPRQAAENSGSVTGHSTFQDGVHRTGVGCGICQCGPER